MGCKTKIGWTDATWNPVTGCTKVSPGCAHCYAERVSNRLQKMGVLNYSNGFEMRMHIDSLDIPFFMKQLGGYPNKQSSPIDWPEDLRVQEYSREMIYHD